MLSSCTHAKDKANHIGPKKWLPALTEQGMYGGENNRESLF
jgi:hypothetical protein